ncbi:lipopolysaccharide-modifying protein [Xylariales sp. PMI_506]|nr:lipopolysaccharide-modifying protein [Xylariales sp. PMI_506]
MWHDAESTWLAQHDVETDTRPPPAAKPGAVEHPIDHLIAEAHRNFEELLGNRSLTLQDAAQRYRERRGRHPPPGFDAWFHAANESRAVVVEAFFDPIYHDIAPFWGLEPKVLRLRIQHATSSIRVRNGRVEMTLEDSGSRYRIGEWARLVEQMSPHIPDLDMPVNHLDETRVVVPWETINDYMAREHEQRRLIPAEEALTQYGAVVSETEGTVRWGDLGWITNDAVRFWDHFRATCPPESPARRVPSLQTFDSPVEFPQTVVDAYTYRGYVRNFTAAQDACSQPHLRGLQSCFVESYSMLATHMLVPIFSDSKIAGANDIVLPGSAYLNGNDVKLYSGGASHGGAWAAKKNALVWRGSASGQRNRVDNWWHSHRNRFVQMLNATTVAAAETGDRNQAPTFELGPVTDGAYGLPPQLLANDGGHGDGDRGGGLSAWIASFANVGYNEIPCELQEFEWSWFVWKKRKLSCSILAPWFSLVSKIPMAEQYNYKYLPDLDGNGYSGRYRAFLRSSSLPLKATIQREWHDGRIFPWLHFVPLDASFVDLYGVLEYLLEHDAEAEWMAAEGQRWAERVLRYEDMKLYVWRLLLEYARVLSDERDRLAFVDDLKNII